MSRLFPQRVEPQKRFFTPWDVSCDYGLQDVAAMHTLSGFHSAAAYFLVLAAIPSTSRVLFLLLAPPQQDGEQILGEGLSSEKRKFMALS
jgi:hypothetical protein